MIVARLGNPNGGDAILIILEPGNIAKIQLGQPVIKKLKDFIPDLPMDIELVIGYSPDVQYVTAEIKKGVPFTTALGNSLNRKENFSPLHDPEALADTSIKDVEL